MSQVQHAWLVLLPAHQQDAPGRPGNVDGPQAPVEAALALGLVHVPHQHDGAAGPLGDARQGVEGGAHLVGPVHVHLSAEIGLQRVQDQEPCTGGRDGVLDPGVGEGKRRLVLVHHEHPAAIGSRVLQPGLDGVPQAVLCRLVDAGHGLPAERLAEQGLASGQPGDDGHHEQGLPLAGVPLDDGDLAEGQVGVVEPVHLLPGHLAHVDEFQLAHCDQGTSLINVPMEARASSNAGSGSASFREKT